MLSFKTTIIENLPYIIIWLGLKAETKIDIEIFTEFI